MKNLYYVDIYTETLKITIDQAMTGTAYKNIFIDDFKVAKEYLKYGYKSEYDLKYDLRQPPKVGLASSCDIEKEIAELHNQFKEFVEEYESYGYSFKTLAEGPEWRDRCQLNNYYELYLYMYLFNRLDFADRLYKFNKTLSHLNWVDPRQNIFGRGNGEEQKHDIEQKLLKDAYSEEMEKIKEENQQKQFAIEPIISNITQQYSDLHINNRLPLARHNDVKNILIVYLAELDILNKLLIGNKASVYCGCLNASGFVRCKVKDINYQQVGYNTLLGYNMYYETPTRMKPVKYIGETYNRLAAVTDDIKFLRNNDIVVIDTNMAVSPIEAVNNTSFYDPDENELIRHEEQLESALNPLVRSIYKDRFTDVIQ